MAVRLSKKVRTYIPTWNGNDQLLLAEQIRIEFKTLTVEDMFEIQRETRVNLFAPQAPGTDDPAILEKHWGLMKYVLSKYTQAWTGISVDGESLTDPKAILSTLGADCLGLLSEVYSHILAASSGTETDAKNSGAGSVPASGAMSLIVSPVSGTDINGSGIVADAT